jgi:peptidoglycan/LPS O-acetylase OafA/YrhL
METPDAVAPPPGHPRFPLLDSLRAVAAIGVLAAHTGYLAGSQTAWYGSAVAQGIAGVTIFFVLSGFLLYRPFLATELDGNRGVRLRDYARRRLLRILPAYWLALTIIALWLKLPGAPVFGHDFWRYYLLLQVYSGHTILGGLGAAWTLCVELSFYLLLPFYAMGIQRLGRGRERVSRLRMELWVLAGLALISLGFRYWTLTHYVVPIYATLLPYFSWFAVGMALAVISVGPIAPRLVSAVTKHPALSWLVAAVVYLALSVLLRGRFDHRLGYSSAGWMAQHVLSAIVAFALVAPAALGHTAGGWPRRVLAWRWLASLGLISYGIYLWQGGWVDQVALLWAPHWGLPSWLPPITIEFVATLALSVACAAISYRFLERPLMRFKNTHRTSTPPATRDPAPAAAPGS